MGKLLYTINTNEADVFLNVIYNPFLAPFKEANPDIDVKNIIDDSLLNDTRLYNGMTPAIATRMLHYAQGAQNSGADGVLVTCTSVNKATKYIRPLLNIPILNIEEPTAELAVKNGPKIGVLATLPTSPKAIIEVIEEKAAEQGAEIEIVTRVADGAFDVLKTGDRAKHDEMVCAALYELAKEVDCVVFAQISMSLLKYDESKVGVPIIMIGHPGLERMKEMIESK